VDLDHVPPMDPDEPLPIPRSSNSKSSRFEQHEGGALEEERKQEDSNGIDEDEDCNQNRQYFKASKLTWAVNDYLQEKSDRLNSFVSSLNTRYVELKKENRTLQNEVIQIH